MSFWKSPSSKIKIFRGSFGIVWIILNSKQWQNPKSKLLRGGRKKSNSKISLKTELANKESNRINNSNNQKPKTSNAGMRFEDAIKTPKIIESVRNNKRKFADKKNKSKRR